MCMVNVGSGEQARFISWYKGMKCRKACFPFAQLYLRAAYLIMSVLSLIGVKLTGMINPDLYMPVTLIAEFGWTPSTSSFPGAPSALISTSYLLL